MKQKWAASVPPPTARDNPKEMIPPMKSPSDKNNPPATPVTTKTMFYTEGSTIALIVTNRGDKRTKMHVAMLSAEAALAWCKANASNLVYSAFDITKS
jgi:hypothetical protein